MKISNKVKNISPSLTLEITAKAKKLKSEGVSIIGFGAGEPDFNTPKYIIDSAKKALDVGFTKYTPASGTAELKNAIVEKFKKDNGLEYKPENVVVSTGAKSSLYHAICAVVEEGDEVIIPSPYWLTYPELVKLAGGKCIFVKCKKENDYKMTANELKDAITDKTTCLILNSPNNPTGSVYSENEIKELANVLENKNITVISDEIYEKLVYEGEKHYSIAQVSDSMKEKTIIVNGMSKTYSMTGWRIGYLVAPTSVAKAISSMQSHTTSNPNSIAQYASVTALTDMEGEKFISEMVGVFDDRRKFMLKLLEEINGISPITPRGAFYIMVDVSSCFGKKYKGETIDGSMSFSQNAIKEGIAVIPGIAFGDDNTIRLSYAISKEDIKVGIERLQKYIEELK